MRAGLPQDIRGSACMKPPWVVAANRGRKPVALALSLLLALASGGASSQGAPDPSVLGSTAETLIDHARQSNPGFAVVRAETFAARERVTSAGELSDPTFAVELMDATNSMNGRPASLLPGEVGVTSYRISQPLPGWGKRDLAVNAARAQATRADAIQDKAWNSLAANIEILWLRYYAADRELSLNRETLALLYGLEELGLARYGLGLLPQQAVLVAQREISVRRLEIVRLEQLRRGLQAEINGLLGRSHDASLVAPADPAPIPDQMEFSALSEAVVRANPELNAANVGLDVARVERKLTYRDRFPDFAVGVRNNRPYESKASWDVMFEVMIPLRQSNRRAKEREAEYLLMAAEARLEDARARASGELGVAWSRYTQGRESLRLLDHALLPQARATRNTGRAALSSGKVDFDSVIMAERQLIDIRTRRLQTELDTRLALTEIKKLTGGFQ